MFLFCLLWASCEDVDKIARTCKLAKDVAAAKLDYK